MIAMFYTKLVPVRCTDSLRSRLDRWRQSNSLASVIVLHRERAKGSFESLELFVYWALCQSPLPPPPTKRRPRTTALGPSMCGTLKCLAARSVCHKPPRLCRCPRAKCWTSTCCPTKQRPTAVPPFHSCRVDWAFVMDKNGMHEDAVARWNWLIFVWNGPITYKKSSGKCAFGQDGWFRFPHTVKQSCDTSESHESDVSFVRIGFYRRATRTSTSLASRAERR
jgi:hypothetical protein